VTAGIDLALALVAEDHGRKAAAAVARQLVVYLRRSGGQAQFSALLAAQDADSEPVQDLRRDRRDHHRKRSHPQRVTSHPTSTTLRPKGPDVQGDMPATWPFSLDDQLHMA
jgi:hypothetical protein